MNPPIYPNRKAFNGGLLLLASTLLSMSAEGGDPPAISAKRAVELGEQALAEKGVAGQVYIQSLALQRTSTFGGKIVWAVTWSDPVPASNPQKREVGIQIDMAGNVVHLIKGPGEPVVKHGPR